jgi:hypothetical protein
MKVTIAYKPLKVAGCFLGIYFLVGLFPGSALAVSPIALCNVSTFATLASPEGSLVIDSAEIRSANSTGADPNVEFCRLKAHIHTANTHVTSETDKEIQIEIRLPSNSNQRYLQYGGTGYDGSIDASQFAPVNGFASSLFNKDFPTYNYGSAPRTTLPMPVQPLNRGFTIAATNSGHVGVNNADASFLNHPNGQDRWINFSYRARHLLAVTAKSAMALYYGQEPRYSYHVGNSAGGRNGVIEANRYPDDFNGILALTIGGATGIRPAWLQNMQKQFPSDIAHPVIPFSPATTPSPMLVALGNATMERCDSQDGLTDGFLSDPATCDFNVDTAGISCPDDIADSTCFTAVQREILKSLYSPTILNGITVYPRFLPGYQGDPALEFANRFTGNSSTILPTQYNLFDSPAKYLVFGDITRTIWNISLEDPADVDAFVNPITPAGFDQTLQFVTPDLSSFRTSGGKLIIIHSLMDPLLSPMSSLEYYQQVAEVSGGLNSTLEFARLFLVPGIGHIGRPTAVGAYGPLDYLAALEQWVEEGSAPDSLTGANPQNAAMTRPFCAYPFKAVYTGITGDIDAMNVANNFQCRFYAFDGFERPVDSLPAINDVKAGQAVPVKFSLGGDWGLNIFADGFPMTEQIACDSSAPADNIQTAVTAGSTVLQYDATTDKYTYVWKTDKSWQAGTCRQLIMRLNEGTTLRANFKIK